MERLDCNLSHLVQKDPVPASHIAGTLFIPLHSMSKMAVCYNYPRLTPGSASNTQQFDSYNNKLRGVEYCCLSLNRPNKSPRCTNRLIQS